MGNVSQFFFLLLKNTFFLKIERGFIKVTTKINCHHSPMLSLFSEKTAAAVST